MNISEDIETAHRQLSGSFPMEGNIKIRYNQTKILMLKEDIIKAHLYIF